MEDRSVVDVKIVSIETIKPSKSTPSHLQKYTLSLMDQIHPPYHTLMLLFYLKTSPGGDIDVNVLKLTLSKTLSTFDPFASRCIDNYTVSCNDEEIPFVETRVNCVLSEFFTSSNKIDHLHKLTPPREYTAEKLLSKLVPLAFQVNVFSCGGVVIGCYKLHKLLLDGTSLVAFLKHWAALTPSGPNKDNVIVHVEPDFNAVLSAFPPRPEISLQLFNTDSTEYQRLVYQCQSTNVVAKHFVFNKDAMTALRAMATSKDVQKPTRFETLVGFIWKHCMASAYTAKAMPVDSDSTVMQVVVNMRTRLNPPLTSMCMGNLLSVVSARANQSMDLSDLVREIHVAVSNGSNKINSYKGGENVEAIVADAGPIMCFKPGMYGVSSWCHFGLDEVDFGFGKPKWVSPTTGILSPVLSRNFIYLTCDRSSDVIEVWLLLEEKEMQSLESGKDFLAFACHN